MGGLLGSFVVHAWQLDFDLVSSDPAENPGWLNAKCSCCFQYFINDCVDVYVGGAMVHKAGAQRELALDRRVRNINPATLDHPLQNSSIPVVQIGGDR